MKNFKYTVLLLVLAAMTTAYGQSDTLVSEPVQKIQLPFASLEKERVVGAVDVIQGDELRRSSEYNISSAMAGMASGLYVFRGGEAPGSVATWSRVRGMSRGGADAPMVVIDGIANRYLENLSIENIESIQILKDITAKMLYGSKAANGVILVTTKRGTNSKRQLSFDVEAGLRTPTFTPSYLDAGTYAEKYNEAWANDGNTTPFYSADDITKYKDGSSPLTHPNEDYEGTFLKDNTQFQRLNMQLQGGDEQLKYYVNLGYIHEDGIEKVGDGIDYSQINLMSNLDYKVNDVVSMKLDIQSKIDQRNRDNVKTSNFYKSISSHRPLDYPFFVTANGAVDSDSLGYNPNSNDSIGNLYGDLLRKGYVNEENYYTQTNLGMDLDFNDYVEGLTASAYVTFDAYNAITMGKSLTYSSFNPVNADSLARVGVDNSKGDESKISDDGYRNLGGNVNVNYDRSFGKSELLVNVTGLLQSRMIKIKGASQDDDNANIGTRINYAFDKRYVVELTSSYMGSDRLSEGNRWKLYGGVGAGWILSNESFMTNVDLIDYLKVKGSYGKMGYDLGLNYLLDQTFYSGWSSTFKTGTDNKNSDVGTNLNQMGNTGLTFEENKEYNIGLEGALLNNTLSFEFNYFNMERTGMPTKVSNSLPDYMGSVKPVQNYNAVSNSGYELSLTYTNHIGDLYYSVGGNMISSEATWTKRDELNQYAHQNRVGQAVDASWGFIADGLYTDADFNADGTTTDGVSSTFGNVMAGDIKYLEGPGTAKDGELDNYDSQVIGNWFPRLNYGVNVGLDYKGFSLYLQGQGVSGVDKMQNTSYHMNYGERKYSELALDAAHPRMTIDQTHSYRSSTYWMEDGSFFKLRKAELMYTLPSQLTQRIQAQKIAVFVRGTDLLAFSKFDDMEVEDLSAGVTKYPMFTTVTGGVKFTF